MAKVKVKQKKTAENVLYGLGVVTGFSLVYYLIGTKFGMPNPLNPRGKTRQQLLDRKKRGDRI